MGENKPKVGLVGCGGWGRHILRDLVSLGAEVIVVERNAERRRRAALSGVQVLEALTDLPEVDGVVIAVQTIFHAEVIEALLPRHVPIFCEKPLCPSPEEAERLAEQASDRLFVMDKWRYHPGVEALREIARSEELGPVLGVRSTRRGWGCPHPDVDSIWILAPHDLSIGLHILGSLPPIRAALAERVGGMAVSLTGFLGTAPWCVIDVSSRDPVRCRRVELHCRDGVALLDEPSAPHIRLFRGTDLHDSTTPEPELRPITSEFPLLRELRVFLKHLAGGPPPRSSAAEAATVVKALAGLRRLAGLE